MWQRRIALAVILVLAALGGAWYGSPYWVTSQMRKAAEAGDGERLAAYVDYPALRENLTAQIAAGTFGNPPDDEVETGPLGPFRKALAGALVAAAVESLVTPESVAALVEHGKTVRIPGAEEVERRRHYASANVFDVDMYDAETKERIVTLVFHRDGWFGWKLAGLGGEQSAAAP